MRGRLFMEKMLGWVMSNSGLGSAKTSSGVSEPSRTIQWTCIDVLAPETLYVNVVVTSGFTIDVTLNYYDTISSTDNTINDCYYGVTEVCPGLYFNLFWFPGNTCTYLWTLADRSWTDSNASDPPSGICAARSNVDYDTVVSLDPIMITTTDAYVVASPSACICADTPTTSKLMNFTMTE